MTLPQCIAHIYADLRDSHTPEHAAQWVAVMLICLHPDDREIVYRDPAFLRGVLLDPALVRLVRAGWHFVEGG
jgi:hypothetical protein